ncbi:MAG: GNAT family N-acetyltransferase [Chitinophagaceae bacterium]|nr:MAG: GNAT family N-acetyltransferase [Chitinophagaceae bacterium]
MSYKLNWILKKFDELTVTELYNILHLRSEVFVVEQNCAYQDVDNKDPLTYHLMGWEQNNLVAYTRIIPPGISYKYPSIGRVSTANSVRRTGVGKQLMQLSITHCENLFVNLPIQIGAQLYLKKFYESFDFHQTSDIYLEDGIEHIEMIKNNL